jgi:multiple sugar transport system substrate-binding protein
MRGLTHHAMSRRGFLVGATFGLGSAVLAACGGASAPTVAPAKPTEAPKPAGAAPTTAPAAAAAKPAEPPKPAAAEPTKPAPQAAAPPKSAAPAEIQWARHGAEDDLKTENALGEIFAQTNPGLTLKTLVLPFNDYNTKIPVMAAGGTAPDVFGAYPSLLFNVYSAKGVRPAHDYIRADKTLNYDDVVFKGDALFEGKIVGLPQKSCTHQLRYNKKLFQEAGVPAPGELYTKDKEKGWNWTAFLDAAKKLTKGNDQFGFAGSTSAVFMLPMIRANGGDAFDNNDNPTKSTLTSPEAKEAFQFMVDLVRTHKVQPGPEMRANELGINFPSGKMATAMGTTCDSVRDLRKGKELLFAWDFVLLPASKSGFRCWGDTDQMVTSSTAKNPEAVYKWMTYRSSKDAWEDLYAKGIALAFSDGPQRFSIFQSKAYTEPLSGLDLKMIEEGYRATKPDPVAPRHPQLDKMLRTFLGMELENALRGAKTVDQALADASRQIDETLKAG